MKIKINGVIVVEGKTDVQKLSSFIDAEFVITNGSALSIDTIHYLKEVSKTKDVIVFTDPDFPGNKIRSELNNAIPNLKNCYVDKSVAIKHNKVGVAETDKKYILEALSKLTLANSTSVRGNLTSSDLYNLHLTGYDNSVLLREKVCKAFSLGHCNNKSFLNKLNSNNITYDKIKEIL